MNGCVYSQAMLRSSSSVPPVCAALTDGILHLFLVPLLLFGLTTKTRTFGNLFGTTQVVGRGSETDKVSREKFRADEEREWANTDPNKQNLKAVMEMADIKLDNTSTLADLHKTLDVIF